MEATNQLEQLCGTTLYPETSLTKHYQSTPEVVYAQWRPLNFLSARVTPSWGLYLGLRKQGGLGADDLSERLRDAHSRCRSRRMQVSDWLQLPHIQV